MLPYILWLLGSLVVAIFIRHLFLRSSPDGQTSEAERLAANLTANGPKGAGNLSWVNDIVEWLCCNVKNKEGARLAFVDALNHSADKVKKNCKVKFVDFKCLPPSISKISFELANQNYFDCLLESKFREITFETLINGEEYNTSVEEINAKIRASCYIQNNQLKPIFSVSPPIEVTTFRILPKETEFSVSTEEAENALKQIFNSMTMQINWPFPQIELPSPLQKQSSYLTSANKSNYINPATMMGRNVTHNKPESPVEMKSPRQFQDECYVDASSKPLDHNKVVARDNFHQQKESLNQFQQINPDNYQQHFAQLANDQQQSPQKMFSPQQLLPSEPNRFSNFERDLEALNAAGQLPMQQRMNFLEGEVESFQNENAFNTLNNSNVLSDSGEAKNYFTIHVIKANGLMELEAGSPACSAYCLISIDNPPQRFSSKVIKQTGNPYWNEEFKALITTITKEIQLDVRDAGVNGEDLLIGRSSVMLEEIARMPSSRQIIPLLGQSRGKSMTSGSVTVEFSFPEEFILRNSVAPSMTPNMSETPKNRQKYAVNKQAGGDLISHHLALNPGSSKDSTPSSRFDVKYATLQPSYQSMPSIKEAASPKKHETLADTIKKKFGKLRSKRSQSADRANNRQAQQQLSAQQQQQLSPQQRQQLSAQQNFQNQRIQDFSLPNPIINVANADRAGSWDDINRHGRTKSFGSSLKKFFRKSRDLEPVRGASLNVKYDSTNSWQSQATQSLDRPKRSTTPVTFNDNISTSDDDTRAIFVS